MICKGSGDETWSMIRAAGKGHIFGLCGECERWVRAKSHKFGKSYPNDGEAGYLDKHHTSPEILTHREAMEKLEKIDA